MYPFHIPANKRTSPADEDEPEDAVSDIEVPKSKKKKKAKKSSRESRSSKRQRPVREVAAYRFYIHTPRARPSPVRS